MDTFDRLRCLLSCRPFCSRAASAAIYRRLPRPFMQTFPTGQNTPMELASRAGATPGKEGLEGKGSRKLRDES